MKVTLGVVAISYNEEEDLPGFLNHLLPWVDEIVIVDDGSTDSTAELCAAAGDKVNFVKDPRSEGEYFSHQRNKGINHSTSDWLLHMDIDERVTPELAKEILSVIRQDEKKGYRFRRLNFFLHKPMKGGGWQDWNLVHLAKREVLRFAGFYHEECVVEADDTEIGQLKNKMWHINDASYQERMRKSSMYCQENAIRISKMGRNIKWIHLVWYPVKEFLNKYFRKRGYRDGVLGVIFALHSACAMFKSHAIVWDQQNTISRQDLEKSFFEKWEKEGNI